uniref:ZP domain-containing protein n=1 Tax=Cyprinodon variegatus TaxID=28743 RepID=A0A3Q2DC34_CYPVA
MGTLQRVLWSFLCCFITVQSFHSPDDLMFHQDFQSPFDDNWFFPFEGNLNFPSFDTIFTSWTQRAESNVYKRGQVVRLQVSAETRPGQQLFIQSCFKSSRLTSPAGLQGCFGSVLMVVLIPGRCASSLGSPHPVALFAATNRLYVHCSVVLSDLGVNTAAKSCNYNSTGSRWEELSGDTEVCDAHLSFLGPLLIVDEWEFSTVLPDSKRLESSGSSLPTTTRASTVPGEDGIVSSAFLSQGELQSSPKGILVVHQEPTTRLTVWLPEQVQGDLPTAPVIENIGGSSQWDTKLVDGWQIPQNDFSFEFQRKSRYDHLDTEKNQPGFPHPTEMDVNPLLVEPKAAVLDATAQESQMNRSPSSNSELQRDAAVEPDLEVQPIIRTKLEFSKGADGSKKLSYEEEVKQQETRHEAKDGAKRKHRLKGLRLTFVDLLRYEVILKH